MEINASSHDQGPTAASGLRICEEASVDSIECQESPVGSRDL